jgi:hypothetical protein
MAEYTFAVAIIVNLVKYGRMYVQIIITGSIS